MRLGLAGAGRIGASHAETLAGFEEVTSVVVADVDPARAQAVAVRLGVEAAEGIDALFRAGLDGLVIAAATDAHPELIIQAVDARVPVFCEKPVAADIPGTLAVIDRIADADVPVQIGFQRRFDAGYQAARVAVESGELGWLHTVRATTLDPAPPPAAYIAHSGGLFRDCGVHDFDIIRWVTGREVEEVFALGRNKGEQFFADSGDVDTAAVAMTLDDGTLATVSLTRYNGAGYDVRFEALGSSGNAVVGLDDQAPLRSVEPGVEPLPGPAYPGFMERFRTAYAAELRAFLDVAAGRIPSPAGAGDALEAFYIAEACEVSRKENRPVRVAEVRR
ncbi:Gfo/Idh/MocA family protein [Amycolatopsis echigonensis]|uniref:Gfo/Idh/MocA family oxidoreductase n=1 Tax=Amycolatopsis echigonensis TaxID=2576905 RepID=A0A2N3WB35_9PSEU|nr:MULTISPECIES: Gfo/Idh/MocA family oxidoreductase [Amycolatopsis]MBB2500671.1 Gfo/Idh/MocA family oxidoreductase [Amycolatopsis echigonensis]PKV91085.1 myo-inositol 2-dehydrogenase/D-chiro-inositol 1-dehydrogenase [Amycolatopsis niigatensis]